MAFNLYAYDQQILKISLNVWFDLALLALKLCEFQLNEHAISIIYHFEWLFLEWIGLFELLFKVPPTSCRSQSH